MPEQERDLVVVGRVGAPHGVRGLISIDCYGSPSQALLAAKEWFIGEPGSWNRVEPIEATPHRGGLIAQLVDITDRDGAGRLRHKRVAVPREALPATDAGVYYWHDLQGLSVTNEQGEMLGEIVDLIETGSNQVLVVRGEKEVLIPFLDDVIKQVDLSAKRAVVDWQAE